MAGYGVEWDSGESSPILTRIASNADLDNGVSFDAISPWTMGRCNLWDDGTPTAYYGDRCYTDTDVANMGQAMVQIPKFWYSIDITGDPHIRWYVSNTGTEAIANHTGGGNITWAVHPAFISHSLTKDYAYIGAYEGSFNGSLLESKSGVMPTGAGTIIQFREAGKLRGTGWGISTIQTYSALQLLYMVEYANLNSQLSLGGGYTNIASAQMTGSTSAYGNASYGASNTYTTPVSYRGVEDIYGNMADFADGINLKIHRLPYVADYGFVSCIAGNPTTGFAAPYTDTTLTLPLDSNDIINVDLSTAYNYIFFAKTTGGYDNTVYFCDDLFTGDTQNNVVSLGGSYTSTTAHGGIFYMNCTYSSTTNGANIGARLGYIPDYV